MAAGPGEMPDRVIADVGEQQLDDGLRDVSRHAGKRAGALVASEGVKGPGPRDVEAHVTGLAEVQAALDRRSL